MDHIHKLKHTMAVLEEQIELLRIQATGMKSTAYDKERVQGGNISTDDRMLSLIEAEEKYQRTVMEYHEAVLVRTQQIAEMEEVLRKKDSATVALRSKIEKALNGFEGQGLNITHRDGKIYLVLDESLLFSVGKSDVAPKGQEVLKNLASVLAQNPDINIQIEGHTDNTGGTKINWELSTKRALAISQILLDNSNIDGKRITVSGRGQYCPIDNSNTAEGRAKNRRSEIILTPDLQELYDILNTKD